MFVNKWSPLNKNVWGADVVNDNMKSDADLLKKTIFEENSISKKNNLQTIQENEEECWDNMDANQIQCLTQTLRDIKTTSTQENIKRQTLTKERLPVITRSVIYQEQSEEEEAEEDEEEDDDGGWLPPDPESFYTLTKEEENFCYNALKENAREYGTPAQKIHYEIHSEPKYLGAYFLMHIHRKNKAAKVVPSMLKTTLKQYEYHEVADCFQCRRRITTLYLKDKAQCDYHVLCKECFVFTQTLLYYTWGEREIPCPQHKMFQKCGRPRKLIAEYRYKKSKNTT